MRTRALVFAPSPGDAQNGLRALSAQTARSDHENDSQLFDCRMADIRVRRRQQRFT
jgi:hypothetical protein